MIDVVLHAGRQVLVVGSLVGLHVESEGALRLLLLVLYDGHDLLVKALAFQNVRYIRGSRNLLSRWLLIRCWKRLVCLLDVLNIVLPVVGKLLLAKLKLIWSHSHLILVLHLNELEEALERILDVTLRVLLLNRNGLWFWLLKLLRYLE